MNLDVIFEDERWQTLELEAIALGAARATLSHLSLDSQGMEFSLLACDDVRIAVLNSDFRDKSGPTNVLSWPETDLSPEVPGDSPSHPSPDPMGDVPLGDIAIAYDTCVREADNAGKPMVDHVTHLIVHGVLHLLGYDHVRDPDATLMERLEVEILGKLGIDNPYYHSDGA